MTGVQTCALPICEMAKKLHLILVPGSSFQCPGYVRIAYCVSYETILRSQKAWETLAENCQKIR